MAGYSKKGLEKRKKEREGYAEFYQSHVYFVKKNRVKCEECGSQLQGHVSEIAHILPKQKYKSIAKEDKNILYLCGMYSKNQCHSKFDDSKAEVIKQMNVYDKAVDRFKKLEEKITENISYKTYDKWEK